MADLTKRFEHLLEKIRNYFIGEEVSQNRKQIILKKWLNLGLLGIIAASSVIALLLFISSNSSSKSNKKLIAGSRSEQDVNLDLKHKKIELGSDATKAETKWQNFLEESIETEGKTRQAQIELLKDVITKNEQNTKSEVNTELEELKARLSYALN